MRKVIMVLVAVLVVAMAHALELNQDYDGRMVNTLAVHKALDSLD